MGGLQLGVTAANMQEVTDILGLDADPLSDFVPWTGTRQNMSGEVVGTGMSSFVWHFTELTLSQVSSLLYYVTTGGVLQASKTVWARTRIDEWGMGEARSFQTFQCVMMCPFEPGDMQYSQNRRFRDVDIRFIQAVPA